MGRLPRWVSDQLSRFPDPAIAPPGEELLAVGSALTPGIVLAGYCRGLFPMPLEHPLHGQPGRRATEPVFGWWSPNPRAVLPLDLFHASRSLRRSMGRFAYSVDEAFADVVLGCADPSRPHGWIDDAMVDLYLRLHVLGFAHSVEVWEPGAAEPAGGVFGVEIGGFFAAESMFHRSTDASKAALAHLVSLLAGRGTDGVLDVQWLTGHLSSLGAVSVPRQHYLTLLGPALELDPVFSRSR